MPVDIFQYFFFISQKECVTILWGCKCKCSHQFILWFVTHQNICYQVQQVAKWQFHYTTHTHTHKRKAKYCRNSTMCTQPFSLFHILVLSFSFNFSLSLFRFSFYRGKNSMFSYNIFSLKCQGFVNQKFLFTFSDGRRYSFN